MLYGAMFLSAVCVCLLSITAFAKLAAKYDFTDKPTARKEHTHPIPLCGGLAMFVACSLGLVAFLGGRDPVLPWMLVGLAMIVAVGVVDDYSKSKAREFPVLPRLFVHIAAAGVAFFGGIRFTGFMNPLTDTYVYLPLPVQFVLTVLWFAGLVTAFNFMDGLDGLSGLLALVPGIVFFIVALNMGQSESAVMAVVFVGAVCAFLRFNLPPAKVYMGDSGAYLLGFMLAAISLHGAFKQATVISMTIPMLAMGIPIFDSMLVVVRRLLAKKPAHVADTKHITHLHFRLLHSGMKPKHVVALIFLLSVCLNLAAVIVMLVS